MSVEKLIQSALEANLALPAHRLVTFTWGNVSAIDRELGLVAIKPSGVPYDQMQTRHIVVLDLDGKVVSGTYRPSSDTPTHLELYRSFPDLGGIVHTHSRWATIWAQAGRDIPALGTTHADYFHGPVPVTRALHPDEIELDYERNTGKVIVETFADRRLDPVAMPGVLVLNHGPFAWGGSADEAVHNAVVLEECAMMAWHTCQLNPHVLPIDENLLRKHYERKHGSQAYYGQR
ncbi:MAG: L-ribulose-5-phosphate 4-epimerase [Clostridiaceae bacterium]|jgi:L-ribulose-5-phosphate 4-epimerase|nr:L-ribulose-5-phosphate 4-epimerase [Clostridiales bacterium]MDD4139322.1 L-ribulose-5-phosphate 4-epimerase [Eubacteriales bacterium]MDD4744079.1 L-ribulose-5-phosphate 4-epimerase [Eubacteriales bacterium]NLB44898.1 L-ribulose-5-phosphate 4-epimerase [Clostridiaceae bacterium]